MLKALSFTGIFLVFACTTLKAKELSPYALPSSQTNRQMVLELQKQIDRVDGEGLPPRSNRNESWDSTIKRLGEEAATSSTLYDLGRVFKRLDATYPNLHAKVFLIPELDEKAKEGSIAIW